MPTGSRSPRSRSRDRLRELDFEIPLAGGDLTRAAAAGDEVRLRDLAPVLRDHLAAGDPMVAYADRLEVQPLADQTLRGYLSGSIDVVLRLPSGRFVGRRLQDQPAR